MFEKIVALEKFSKPENVHIKQMVSDLMAEILKESLDKWKSR